MQSSEQPSEILMETNEFELSYEDLEIMSSLSSQEFELIDSWLLKHTSESFSKVAMVVAKALEESDSAQLLEHVSDAIFGLRIEKLVSENRLIAQGNVRNMRYSEVKLA